MHESCVPLRNHRARLRFTGAHALYYEIRLQGLWLGIEAVSGMDECRIGSHDPCNLSLQRELRDVFTECLDFAAKQLL